MKKRKIGLIILIVIILGGLVYKNWTVIKYELRLANIRYFQKGEISGASVTQLPFVYHKQEHSLSCEIAALKMALAIFGIDIPENELITKLNFDPTSRAGSTWGNPFTGFVGDIDAKMMIGGYGVYWDPIAEVAKDYANAEVKQFDAQTLAQEISDGHPVVTWGYAGRGKKVTWTTPDGKKITAINGEHARTVVGFTGDVSNPDAFIILDPIYGQLFWQTKDLMNNWDPFNHMGVAVSPKLTVIK